MGLFSRKKKESAPPEPPKPPRPVQWRHDPEKPTDKAAEYYGDTIIIHQYWYPDVRVRGVEYRDIDFSKLKNDDVDLVPEPENEYDHQAVRVEQGGQFLGYLPANRLQAMFYEFPQDREFNVVTAKLVAVDQVTDLIEIEMDFCSLYLSTCADYPDESEPELSVSVNDEDW